MLEARWGFTTPFHSHSKCWKCLYSSLQELSHKHGFHLQGQGCCQAAAQSSPWAVLELPQQCGVGEGTAVPLVPIPSLCPPAGAGQEEPAEPLWPKKSHQWTARRGTTIQLSCASSGHRAAGPSCGSNPLLPAPLTKKILLLLQFRQLNWTSEVRLVRVTPKNELDGISAFIVLRK